MLSARTRSAGLVPAEVPFTAKTTFPAPSTVIWLVAATLAWTPAVPSGVAVEPPLPASL